MLMFSCALQNGMRVKARSGTQNKKGGRQLEKLSNSLVVTQSPLPMPVNPTHTIGGTRCIGVVLGEGQVSLVNRVCPHALRGGTSADDSRSFVMVFKHVGYFFWWKAL